MSLNFLSPVFLFGLLGIAIPILIHLMTRRQKKYIRFSAVYLLFQSKKRSIKKSTPNRLLLLLIRCLGILLLSLGLAHPIFSFDGPADLLSTSPSASVFILDDSYSMGMRTEDSTLYAQAVSALLEPVGQIPAKSVYSIVLASQSTRLLLDWTEDPTLAEKLLKTSRPSFETTRIGKAVTKAIQLLESATQKEKQIFIFTDLDKNGWKKDEFSNTEQAGKHYPVTIMDFSAMRTGQNSAAVKKAEVSQEFLTNSRIIRVKSRLENLLPNRPIKELNVSLKVNGKQKSQANLKFSAGEEEVKKEFTFPMQGNEAIEGTVEIPDDALNVDNKRFFSYQPDQKIKALVIDGDPKTIAHQRETFYLENALNPFTVALSNIEPTVSTVEQLQIRSLFDFSVVLLCNVRDLPFDYERELEKYVQRGGALFIALGNEIDPKYYNEKLGNLLPVSIKALHQVGRQDKPFRLDIKKSAHPVLKVFKGKSLEEMKSIRFNSLYSVEPRENRKYTVPLKFTNKYPAVVESDFGKGKVVLYVSSVDRDWNDFPIQPTFLPWIQRWVKYSARGLESILHQQLLVGETFERKEVVADTLLFVESPDGKITQLAGTSFEDTFTPGVYRLFRLTSKENSDSAVIEESKTVSTLPDKAIPAGTFTVNIDTLESDSEKITAQEVRQLLGNLQVQFSSGMDSRQTADSSTGTPLAMPFLLMVAGILLLEGFMIRRE
jgi:hypothetical protein